MRAKVRASADVIQTMGAIGLLLAGCGTVPFQPGTAVDRPTRADLAFAYLGFDRAFSANPPTGDRLAAINREFDQASLTFFNGDYGRTVREVRLTTLKLLNNSEVEVPAAWRLAASLGVRIEPTVFVRGSGVEPAARFRRLYDWGGPAAGDEVVALRFDTAIMGIQVPISVPAGGGRVALPFLANAPEPGTHEVSMVLADGVRLPTGRWWVASGSLDAARRANGRRLSAISGGTEAIRSAIGTCKSRNGLLSDQSSEENSAVFLGDPVALAEEVSREIDALERGENPYRDKTGDLWKKIHTLLVDLPYRVYAPPGVADRGPAALVIAFHGAGGDENMFFESYGAGLLKRLAQERGFIAVTPATVPVLTRPGLFERLLAEIRRDYSIDPRRIYVVGHSLGAGAAISAARSHADQIAGVCAICGGRGFDGALPAALVFAGELDPIVPADGVERAVGQAAAAGKRVEFRKLANYGHTLAVNAALPEAIDWLLKLRLDSTSKPRKGKSR